MKKTLPLLFVLVLMVVSACTPVDGSIEFQPEPSDLGPYTSQYIQRYFDQEAGVVCWVYNGKYPSISCLPVDQTKLDWDEVKK